ncbi:MAG: FAD-binding oxidoreductase [Actinobacteria bacterium]|nr:FAD-binding oxidoreductase [Actinomycetota bacterium]
MDTERTVVPAVRDALAAACPSLREAGPADAVAGVMPSFAASPAGTDEASALLRAAASAGLSVVPRGAGTGLSWGRPPSSCDLVVDMRSMNRVIEHAAGDLVAQVQAGATIGQLNAVLAGAGQQLALDAPHDATVGGVIATGIAGPRRFRYGAPRDLLIGVTAVRADGVVARSGGKVVKNVAGYDLGKLLAGSQGTLGLITEATFRLHPVPPAVAYVTAEFGPPELARVAEAVAAASVSPLVPSAVELDWPGIPRPPRVGVLLEGTSSGVAERAQRMSELLASAGGSVTVAEPAPPRWGQLPSPSTVVRVSFWVSRLGEVLEAVALAGPTAGVRPVVTGPAGAGLLYACLEPSVEPDLAARFAEMLRSRLSRVPARGSVAVLAGPLPAAVGALGEVPGAGLMRAVKDQFDPGQRMFPGRLPIGD